MTWLEDVDKLEGLFGKSTTVTTPAPSDGRPRGYRAIKNLASREGIPIPCVLAMSRVNDPFYAGSPTQVEQGQWFAHVYEQGNHGAGIHLRRIHYQLIGQVQKPDGTTYQNTDSDWAFLNRCSMLARGLRMVDASAFVDRRNPDPHIFVPDWEEEEREALVEAPEWKLPSLELDLTVNLRFPVPEVYGYDYSEAAQPIHLEVWIEKSTQNDVLIPVCRTFGINLVTSVGFQSATSPIRLLERVAEREKPARIFYISDFDPAGDCMPVSVARQIEFWISENAPEIKLQALALTRRQVLEYDLPRQPIKESDRRRSNFEDLRGEGAVELDALESLHPGELGVLVRHAVQPYRDDYLEDALAQTEAEAGRVARAAWDAETEEYEHDLREISEQAEAVLDRYRPEVERIREEMERDLAPLRERLEGVRQAVQDEAEEFAPDLPERPEPQINLPDESGWLYDSNRDYFEQLAAYKEHKPTQRRRS